MSYQVLARKWRPKKFAEVAGQGHVLKSLINALDNERLHHAYLFTGTRGVGKTTLARILAKCLNCEKGVTSEPCEACSTCTEINEGRFIDLIEVDAASRTKVEDTRELLDNVQYSSTRGRFKVYLIDEVHMLSNHSFNALLKTLEEPPAHVKFLFATTDPQKLPITTLSRCLQFNLKNLSPKLIVEYLEAVMQQEQIKCDSDALWQLAAAASGSAAICLMHMQGEPRTMQKDPRYADVVAEVGAFLAARAAACVAAGIPAERLVLDPGFGFGKTLGHNLALLRDLERLRWHNLPILVGLSRKRMLGELTGRDVEERMAGSVSLALLAAQRGANIVRVHDVGATRDALRILEAVQDSEGDEP